METRVLPDVRGWQPGQSRSRRWSRRAAGRGGTRRSRCCSPGNSRPRAMSCSLIIDGLGDNYLMRQRRGRRAGAPAARRAHLGVSFDHRVGDHHFVHRLHAARARHHRLVHLFRRGRLRRCAAAVSQPRRHAAAARKRLQSRARVHGASRSSRACGARDRRVTPPRSSTPTTTCTTARGAERRAYDSLERSWPRSRPR